MPEPKRLPVLDKDPDEWGPDHDQLRFKKREVKVIMARGNEHGRMIEPDDDTDNGMDIER